MNKRSKRLVGAAGALLATIALVGGASTAATAVGVPSIPNSGSVDTASTIEIPVFNEHINGSTSVRLNGFTCPPDHPWLTKHTYGPGFPIIGLSIIEPGG
jgi:hypothetical protein